MASSSKRLKLSRRKNNPQPDITQSNENSVQIETSTSSSRDNGDQNQHTTIETTVSSSLQNLREKLKESLPKLPNWRKFAGFPDGAGENFPSETNKDLASEDESCQEERIASFSRETSTVEAQIKPPGEETPTKNLFIEQCPLCPLYFPHDWDQQQIQSHVSTHLDAEDFD